MRNKSSWAWILMSKFHQTTGGRERLVQPAWLAVHFDPAVHTNEWVENRSDQRWPVLVKEYYTPAGTLRAEVFKDETWRWGNHVPFFDDYLESRSIKFVLNANKTGSV